MTIDSPMEKEDLFKTGTKESIWTKYAGFLDLTVKEFMDIQQDLLLDQINLVSETALGWKLMNYNKPQSIAEFRACTQLTTYENYAPYLDERNDDILVEKPLYWVHTAGRSGKFKWMPYTRRGHRTCLESAVSGMFLACASKRNDTKMKGTEKLLYNTPPFPYFSGMLSNTLSQLYDFNSVIPLETFEKLDFQQRTAEGFKLALRTGIDILASMSVILVKIGEQFEQGKGAFKVSPSVFHPMVLSRLICGWIKSGIRRRKLLPRDIWKIKAIVCGGTDTTIYRNRIIKYWGKSPYEIYASTESGFIALQSWTRKDMTFLPFSCFYEFIPESEWLKNRQDSSYQPSTVLINELQAGHKYELVITNFYGMPLLRYRLGDLIKITSSNDDEAGINLPQMVFESRVDDILDLSGLTRLDEKTIWQAISSCNIEYSEWTIRKELTNSEPALHLYIEPMTYVDPEYLKDKIDCALQELNSEYKDYKNMLGFNPLKVTLLAKNTFLRYYQEQQEKGADLAHLKPDHISPADSVIEALLRANNNDRSK